MIEKTILVVDDDYDIREQVSLFLRHKGFTVITCEGEVEATKTIGAVNFDLAILDLMMENKDSGVILGHKIKKKNPRIPIIMISAVTKETGLHFDAAIEDEQRWMKADVFLPKDIRFEDLHSKINQLLSK
ncbi:MAG: response regulator [Oligoflexia bacterium]|nr:response regulator [Oligoflexia bacterium]MBF0366469.1 response regulator [Oligoflexia bacterium]